MSPAEIAIVLLAGGVAGAVNAAAGGGTLIAFPALLAVGLGAREANITTAIGMLASYSGGAVAYRRELADQSRRVRELAPVAVGGGLAGALLLLLTPASSFRAVVPFLLIGACALMLAQPRIAKRFPPPSPRYGPRATGAAGTEGRRPFRLVAILLAGVYGAYFGGGLGVVLLALFGLLIDDDLQRLNALKGVLSLMINIAGGLVFAISGEVRWDLALLLGVGAWSGAHLGVALARRLPAEALRGGVVALGLAVAGALLAGV